MMQKIFLKGTVTVLLLLLVTSLTWGADPGTSSSPAGIINTPSVPNLINFQGRLTDASGNPVADGSHTVNFTLWTLPSGGSNVWTENTSQTTTSGLFTHNLGSVTAFSSALFETYDSLYLQIQADGQTITPRIRLTSTPYTRLANNLETGLGTTASLVTYNTLNGGNLDLFDEAGNYMAGFEADGNGTGGYLYVYRNVGLPGFFVDGNSGGGGSPTIGFFGSAQNIYFDMGYANADTAIQFPDDAINAAEVVNEPGISSTRSVSLIDLTSTSMVDLVTTTITIPSSGYIVVRGSGYLYAFGTTGVNEAVVQIDETAGGVAGNYLVIVGESEHATTGGYFDAFTAERVYFKPAGTYTFRLEGELNFAITGTCRIVYPQIIATFFPTSYGSVSALVSASEAQGFGNSLPVPSTDLSTGLAGSESQVSYQVDLRELELKVAKAQAEFEKTRRELMEAKIKQNQMGQAGIDRK